MENVKCYENYPSWIILVSNSVSLGIYAAGLVIMFSLGPLFGTLYVAYFLILEYRLLRYHCTNCFYWGKSCGFGQGRLSAVFFKKGDITKFGTSGFSWKDMIPDLMVSLIPLITGIVLLIINFSFVILFAVLVILILTTMGNGFVRGQLTCKHCRQKELGCPADMLFNKVKVN